MISIIALNFFYHYFQIGVATAFVFFISSFFALFVFVRCRLFAMFLLLWDIFDSFSLVSYPYHECGNATSEKLSEISR